MKKQFVAYFWYQDWASISLGLHISLKQPNVEIHLPCGFVRIGWVKIRNKPINYDSVEWRCLGLGERYEN